MDEQLGLGPQDEAFIDDAVKSGRYASRDEVVREGLRVLREREDRLAAIRAAVQRGIEDADAGRMIPLEEAFDRVDAMLDEMEAAKRA
jgi:antitoxin ParD1/3/4